MIAAVPAIPVVVRVTRDRTETHPTKAGDLSRGVERELFDYERKWRLDDIPVCLQKRG